MSISLKFVETIYAFSKSVFPKHVYEKAHLTLMDYLCVTAAGNHVLKSKFENLKSSDTGNSTIIGLDGKYPLMHAAMVNAYSSHYLELDDGHRGGMIHLGSPMITAILMQAEMEQWDNQKVLDAIIIAYEAAIILAKAIQPKHKKAGYHTSATVGSIAAVLAIGCVQGKDVETLHVMLSMAATSCAGILRVQDDASELKPFNISQAVVNIISVVFFGDASLRGVNDVFADKKGFLDIFGGNSNDVCLEREEGVYQIETIYIKPYPSCRHCHSPYEAALRIREKGMNVEDIEKVEVGIYQLAIAGHEHNEIKGINSAKLSIPYNVALGLYVGLNNMAQYSEEAIQDEKLLDLCRKIVIYEDKELTALCPRKRSAVVSVFTKSGTYARCRVDDPKGEPENPLSKQEFLEKFTGLLESCGYSSEKALQLYELSQTDMNYIQYMKELRGE